MSVFHLQRKTNSGLFPGTVSEIASVRGMSGGQIVTAVRTPELKLISWRVTPAGSIVKMADSGNQAGRGSHFAITRGDRVVTAGRTEDGNLRLISWDVDPDTGAITRAGDWGNQAGTASRIKIVPITDSVFATAFRSGNGRVMLISWRVNSNGTITRLGDSGNTGDPAAEVALLRLATAGGSEHNLVTPVIDSAGNLKVIHWVASLRGSFTRGRDSGVLATGANFVQAGTAPLNRPVVAYRDQSGQSRLIVCALASDGRVQRLSDSGTQAGDLTVDSVGGEHNGVVTACRFPGGLVTLVGWTVDSNGVIARCSDNPDTGNLGSQITIVADTGVSGISTVTATRTPDGALRLVGWGQAVVRVHFKILRQPRIGLDRMVEAAAEVFRQVGIRIEHASTELLDLGEEFLDIEVGSCRNNPTDEQIALFQHRRNAGPNDIVIYVVRGLDPILGGCAAHPPDRPGAIVASFVDEWTVPHEIGHVLGLNHVENSDRLMFNNGTIRITNPPPDLVASEAATMLGSPYTV